VENAVGGRDGRRPGQHRRRVVQHRLGDRRQRFSRERRTPGQHLEQDHPRGKQIRALVHRVAQQLFRCRVPRRTDEHARGRDRRRRLFLQQGRRTGESEVEHLHASFGDEHVRRLEIAMDDAPPVQHGQRIDDGNGDPQRFGGGHGDAGEARGQRLAVDQLHGDERLIVPLAELEDLTDQRVRDARRDPRLALEAQARRGIGVVVPQHLQRDVASQTLVFREVHDPHAASSEHPADAVVIDLRRQIALGGAIPGALLTTAPAKEIHRRRVYYPLL
jgi:hypothetical protein